MPGGRTPNCSARWCALRPSCRGSAAAPSSGSPLATSPSASPPTARRRSSPSTPSRASSARRSGARIHRALSQRAMALDHFVADCYGAQRALRHGVVPGRLVYSSTGYLRDIVGVRPPRSTWCHVAGIDVVRVKGSFCVLEDNVRVPSGIAYALEARRAMEEVAPGVVRHQRGAPHRRVHQAAVPDPAADRAATVGGGHRGAHPGPVQRRVLRAQAARRRDGRDARRGPRPDRLRGRGVPPRRRGQHPARRRHLLARQQRVARPARVPQRVDARRARDHRGLAARQRGHRQRARAQASPTTRRSTRTCRR